jgi:type II restriction enzyme
MGLTKEQIHAIENILKLSLRNKFETYKPETESMPFHTRLLGKDRLALYSFIHSLSTNFGTSIFEPVAVILASTRFKVAKSHAVAGEQISENALFEIQKIMDNLTAATGKPNKAMEIEIIRQVADQPKIRKVKPTLVDLYLENETGEIFLFDLKTAKPNKGGFKEFKRTLLEWVGVVLASNPKAKVNTFIAIPYNPYEPKPYSRWTMAGMLDLEFELKVAKEFWDFVGGDGAYEDLLDCFERVGIEMRSEIDKYFSKFNRG